MLVSIPLSPLFIPLRKYSQAATRRCPCSGLWIHSEGMKNRPSDRGRDTLKPESFVVMWVVFWHGRIQRVNINFRHLIWLFWGIGRVLYQDGYWKHPLQKILVSEYPSLCWDKLVSCSVMISKHHANSCGTILVTGQGSVLVRLQNWFYL